MATNTPSPASGFAADVSGGPPWEPHATFGYGAPMATNGERSGTPHGVHQPWYARFLPLLSQEHAPEPQPSGMYTIIPMSDSRLQPQITTLRVALATLCVSLLMAMVFVLVPRGVNVGTPTFIPHDWHTGQNATTYFLRLEVHIPVDNANYYPAAISGSLKVLFLDVEAGSDQLIGLTVPSRTWGHDLSFCMDASGVPVEYSLAIIQICMLYPRKLMFVCKAELNATTWLGVQRLQPLDSYFMLNCGAQGSNSETLKNACAKNKTRGWESDLKAVMP